MPNDRLSAQEALIYAMMTASAVDRSVSLRELERIGSMIRELPAFKGLDHDWLAAEGQSCGRLLSTKDGLEKVLGRIAAALPPPLRETAYVLAAEVVASDLAARPEEVHFLDLLASRLELDSEVCAALRLAANARHRTAGTRDDGD